MNCDTSFVLIRVSCCLISSSRELAAKHAEDRTNTSFPRKPHRLDHGKLHGCRGRPEGGHDNLRNAGTDGDEQHAPEYRREAWQRGPGIGAHGGGGDLFTHLLSPRLRGLCNLINEQACAILALVPRPEPVGCSLVGFAGLPRRATGAKSRCGWRHARISEPAER